jgi:predicted  nucleic acid-binding Zn-ribbon protein
MPTSLVASVLSAALTALAFYLAKRLRAPALNLRDRALAQRAEMGAEETLQRATQLAISNVTAAAETARVAAEHNAHDLQQARRRINDAQESVRIAELKSGALETRLTEMNISLVKAQGQIADLQVQLEGATRMWQMRLSEEIERAERSSAGQRSLIDALETENKRLRIEARAA